MSRRLYENLHKLYPVSKTLRFELKPIGKTLENIKNNAILEKDQKRNESYFSVKKLCDEYHKIFIDSVLKRVKLEQLDKYYELYVLKDRSELQNKEFDELQTNLRKTISDAFTKDERFNGLFGKPMITEYLMEMLRSKAVIVEKDVEAVSEFQKFTTYFNGFNTNRANMYVADKKSTAISYRIINENLAIFINNILTYKKLSNILGDKMDETKKEVQKLIDAVPIENIFEIDYFNECLHQEGINIYNHIVAGDHTNAEKKIKGINEYVNEASQKLKIKLPKFRQLYKQILSDKDTTSFFIDSLESDEELIDALKDFYDVYDKKIVKGDDDSNLVTLMSNIAEYDLNQIYINNDFTISTLSNEIFEDWQVITNCIYSDYDEKYTGKKVKGTEKYEEERKKYLKNKKVFSINYINECINKYSNFDNRNIVTYIKTKFNEELIKSISEKYNEMLEVVLSREKELLKDENAKEAIKNFLDCVKELQEKLKYFIPKEDISKSEEFYSVYYDFYDSLRFIIPLYNKTRNYLTRKPYSEEKIKINFETPTLLDGWDLNKETANLGILLKKENNYYLGIMNSNSRNIFENIEESKEENCYQKMEYKLLPGPNKMLPKVFFSNSRIEEFAPSKELLKKYSLGKHKKGDSFDLEFCHELIDFFKESIEKHEDWKNFDFKFSDTKTYNDISEFYREVETQGYKVTFKNISSNYIDELVKQNKLYLFQIYNKDFSENKKSKGKDNLHTLYWKALFDENNRNTIVYKLNGKAEIFFRKASLPRNVTHPKNLPLENKTNRKVKKTFTYDLIKDKRYTEDKFHFHVPLTMNFASKGQNNINELVNKEIKALDDIYIIGIDRGERNLLYICLIDSKGNVIEQYSLNEIINEYNGNTYKINYHELLSEKEKGRNEARQNWTTIENIKELKEGYLSQVIHKIVLLMEKYNAIIVLEDLNNGFKNSRIKVEKQVYQKFEKMLIEKLNYLVIKDKSQFEYGGLFNPYQLTNKFESFDKMSKQSGVLFYIPAWNTSKIDPTTGFVNLLRLKYESVEEAKKFFSKFDDIKYNAEENYFEFYVDYTKFINKEFGIRQNWVLCTNYKRIKIFRNKEKNGSWDTEEVILVNEFKSLFDKYEIDINNLKEEILSQNSKEFFESLINLVKLMLQMRNSIPNSMTDYLVSPVKNKKGEFFISSETAIIHDADANGAYNIARKGLMLIDQIKKSDDSKLAKIKFDISNKAWLEFAQSDDEKWKK